MRLLSCLFFLILFSCSKSYDTIEHPEFGEQDIVTDASGVKYPGLEPPAYQYCGPGWGAKMCRFLNKYDGTVWTDSENYYSDFSDIKFQKFTADRHFISFFNKEKQLEFDKDTSFATIFLTYTWVIKTTP